MRQFPRRFRPRRAEFQTLERRQVLSAGVGDANGDGVVGTADYALWAAQFGQVGPAIAGDFDGSGEVGSGDYVLWAQNFGRILRDQPGVMRPGSLGLWLLDRDLDTTHEIDFLYGLPGDKTVVGNWGGAGDFAGVVRVAADGLLHWYLDEDGDPTHELDVIFGLPGDIPVVGDWDGDGDDNVGVVRGGYSDNILRWFLDTIQDNDHPVHEIEIRFGLPGDIPVVGNWGGSSRDNVGVVRGGYSDNILRWLLDTDRNNDDPKHEIEFRFGLTGDIPVVGDWNGMDLDRVGVVRGGFADSLLRWYLNLDDDQEHESEWQFGLNGDRPVVGRWSLPEIVVGGLSDGQGDVINFGEAQLLSLGPERTFAIRNEGSAPLNITTITAPPGYSILARPFGVLAPGATAELVVQLNTTERGSFSGRVEIHSSDWNDSPFDFPIYGFVGDPEISVHLLPDMVPCDGSRIITFPSQYVGDIGATLSFEIRNEGDLPLRIDGIDVPPGFVRASAPPPAALAAGHTYVLKVRQETATPGTGQAALTIHSSDRDESPCVIRLQRNVTIPPPDIAVFMDGVSLADNGPPVYFGTSWQNGNGANRTFTIRNDFRGDLTIQSLVLPDGYFLLDPPPAGQPLFPNPIPLNASVAFRVQMDTLIAAGPKNGKITIVSNDPDESPFDITIEGELRIPQPDIRLPTPNGGVCDAERVKEEQRFEKSITISNAGILPLLVNVSIPSPSSRMQLIDPPAASIPAGGVSKAKLLLDTSQLGTFQELLTVNSNDPDTPVYTIAVKWTVYTTREILVRIGTRILSSGDTVDFGTIVQGYTTSSRVFTVTNVGQDPLAVGLLGQPRPPLGFSLVDELRATLNPNQSDTFEVRLNNTVAQSYSETLVIPNNDPYRSPFLVNVRGVVQAANPTATVYYDPLGGLNLVEYIQDGGNAKPWVGNQRFYVSNTGNAPLVFSAPAPTATGSISIVEPFGATTLLPGESTSFVGRRVFADGNGTVTFYSNDSLHNPFNFGLGTGGLGGAINAAVVESQGAHRAMFGVDTLATDNSALNERPNSDTKAVDALFARVGRGRWQSRW